MATPGELGQREVQLEAQARRARSRKLLLFEHRTAHAEADHRGRAAELPQHLLARDVRVLGPLLRMHRRCLRLLAPLHMMAADAGSSSEGVGSAKKRPATEEPGSLDTLWEGFMTAQVNATHSNLRAIAHAGRLDDMRKIIWSSYNENPTECADTDLAMNCKSQDKFIAYTLRQDLIPIYKLFIGI